MKKVLFAILVSAVMALAAGSADKGMAVGGWLQAGNAGEHAGLDVQFREAKDITIDIYLRFYFSSGDNALGAYLGYYWNFYLTGVPQELGRMGFYVGPAGGLGWWDVDTEHQGVDADEMGFAIRVGLVGGYQWEFPVVPLQLYLELNPVGEAHLMWYDYDDDDDDLEDDDQDWKLPDVYFRIGLRFWF